MLTKGAMLLGRTYRGWISPPAAVWENESRYSSNGTITTATWQRLQTGLWALDFNSDTPDHVEITCPQCNFTSEDYSIVTGIKIDDLSAFGEIFIRGLIATDGFDFVLSPPGQVLASTFQAAASQYSRTPTGILSINTWYTLGLSRSGNSIKVFVDGIDETTFAGVHVDPLTSARTAKIGVCDDLTTYPFDGQIAFLKVFNYTLSAAQHYKIHQSTRTLFGV